MDNTVYVVTFDGHPHYPEDRRILGVFGSEDSAYRARDWAIERDRQANPNHPLKAEQQERYYSIDEFEVE